MHPRVESMPKPSPDYRRFEAVLRREVPDRVPLIELAVHPMVVNALLDEPLPAADTPCEAARATVERAVRVHHRLGYDAIKVSAGIPFDIPRLGASEQAGRVWANEGAGPIQSRDDCARYAWPQMADVDFSTVDAAVGALPDGMGIIGFSGGVLEFAMDLLGMQNFMLATRRTPALVEEVINRVGGIIEGVFAAYCQIDEVRALWLGDDLGHKHGLLVSPGLLESHVLPWYRRFVELAHNAGRPFLLHSCGNTATIMPQLVEAVGIDAKHSFEDGIEPVETFYSRWHRRVAVLGGVDVHLLSTGEETAIRARMTEILEQVAPLGGYAAGSGNSIPDYVPPENYLAMVEAVQEFNGLR